MAEMSAQEAAAQADRVHAVMHLMRQRAQRKTRIGLAVASVVAVAAIALSQISRQQKAAASEVEQLQRIAGQFAEKVAALHTTTGRWPTTTEGEGLLKELLPAESGAVRRDQFVLQLDGPERSIGWRRADGQHGTVPIR